MLALDLLPLNLRGSEIYLIFLKLHSFRYLLMVAETPNLQKKVLSFGVVE